ncbi:hypothetical protein UK23_27190 [Lentzea aerocolonigenes]|uniref:Transglutaminase-like domain-containing protein n=1 Tax=Lentzea aerocolonigenes TaxID=68170 RepID=A0A0F0GSX0_LENAE|nr:DUF3488 and transglutaminase-like domain-containing protein [Lentzea aerocolonigenes]KJK45102.1 hypothetical protein UK23_27190 [Lentzea aerocolonigenes]
MNWRRFVPGGPLAEVLLALVACAAGTLVYQRFFTTDYLPVLLGACLVGGVTAALGHRRVWTTLVLAVAGLAAVMIYGVFGGATSAVLGGVRGSWNRLLTVAAPADAWGELLATPALVAWAAAFSSVVLVLRTRSAMAPLLPSLAGFLFALFVAGNQAGGHLVATVAFLVAALCLVAVRTHRGAGGASVRVERRSSKPVAALLVVGSVVAASALFGVAGGQFSHLATGEHRFDLRDMLAPPVVGTDTLTPLAQLKKQLNESPPRTLFTVRTDAESAALISRVRTAALDTFDGTTWTAGDTYRVAGSYLTGDPELVHRKPITARIEVQQLTGPYLPVIGWPSRLDVPGETRGRFGFDPDSGVVVSTGPTSLGFRYDVTGEIYQRDKDLPRATPVVTPTPPLPDGVPEALRELASTIGQRYDNTRPRERLDSLETDLRSRVYLPNAPPGHSYAALARALSRADGTGGGYAEQYSAVFTLVARMWGYPARVAVGYRLRTQKDGVIQVTTADAHAWSEVHFAGYGWVAYDPGRDDNSDAPTPPPEAPRVVPPPPSPSTTAPPLVPPAQSQPADAPDDAGFRWSNVLSGTFVLIPSVVLLVLLAGGLVVLGKAGRRRQRRRGPDLAARVLGAWHEQLDRLTERGITPPVSLTFHEVARHVRGSLGDAANPITASAELATTAVYAPELLSVAEADHAWELVARLNAGLYPGRISAARLRAALDPRPLWTSWSNGRRRWRARESLEMGRYR